jgi:hypothetical protein
LEVVEQDDRMVSLHKMMLLMRRVEQMVHENVEQRREKMLQLIEHYVHDRLLNLEK